MDRKFMKNETFGGMFPFKPHFKEINGFNMHYVDEGDGDPLVCLHGMPTWSFLYRKFIKDLSGDYRVLAPDHMGFGKSDVPQDKSYTMAQHVDNLSKLMLTLNLTGITLVVQDWGGPIGLGFAVEHPDRVKNLVIMNTSVGVAREGTKPWYSNMEKKGIYEEFFGNMKENIPKLFRLSIFHQEIVTPALIDAYTRPFPNKESCIGALAFPRDIPIGFSHQSANAMQHVRENLKKLESKPKILIWGMKDPVFPPMIINRWELKLFPGIVVKKIDDASHFLQEDAPEQIISLIREFLVN